MKKRICFLISAVLLLTAVCGLCVSAETADAHNGDVLLFSAEDDTVTEAVEGDLLAFSTSLRVTGQVGGNIRAFSSTEMLLNGAVARNVTVASVIIECGSNFSAGDVILAGSEVAFGGKAETMTVYADTVIIDGTVEGKLKIEASQVILLESAVLSDAEIISQYEPVVAKSADATSFTALKDSAFAEVVSFKKAQSDLITNLQSLLYAVPAAILLALLWVFTAGKATKKPSLRLRARPVGFLLRGFGILLALPIAALFLIAMIFTMSIGGVLLLLFILIIIAAEAITADVLGRIWMPSFNRYASAALLAAAISVLTVIPFVGTLLAFGCWCVAFGTLASMLFDRKKDEEELPPSSETPDSGMDFRV